MSELAVAVDRSPVRVRLTLAGTVDLDTRDTVINTAIRELDAGPVPRLEFDVGAVVFCDSSGISAFIAVRRIAASRGTEVALIDPSAQFAQLLAVTGLGEHFG